MQALTTTDSLRNCPDCVNLVDPETSANVSGVLNAVSRQAVKQIFALRNADATLFYSQFEAMATQNFSILRSFPIWEGYL